MYHTNLDFFKQNLSIESGYTEQDQYLIQLLNVAEYAVIDYLNYSGVTGTSSYSGVTLSQPEIHLIYLFATHLYQNRSLTTQYQQHELAFNFFKSYRNPVIT